MGHPSHLHRGGRRGQARYISDPCVDGCIGGHRSKCSLSRVFLEESFS